MRVLDMCLLPTHCKVKDNANGDCVTAAMRPFAELLWTLLVYHIPSAYCNKCGGGPSRRPNAATLLINGLRIATSHRLQVYIETTGVVARLTVS